MGPGAAKPPVNRSVTSLGTALCTYTKPQLAPASAVAAGTHSLAQLVARTDGGEGQEAGQWLLARLHGVEW
jgi:hypothetical protein